MARIGSQHLAKQPFGRAPIAGSHGQSGLIDARALGIELPGLLEGDARFRVLLLVHEQITVGEPRALQRRAFLQHTAQQLAGRIDAPTPMVGASKLDARGCQRGRRTQRPLEHIDGLLHLVLRQ